MLHWTLVNRFLGHLRGKKVLKANFTQSFRTSFETSTTKKGLQNAKKKIIAHQIPSSETSVKA